MEKHRNKIPTRKRPSNLKRLELLAQHKQKENSNSDPGSVPVFASVNPRPRRSSLSALKREQLIQQQQQQQNHRHHSQLSQQQHHQYHNNHSNDLSHQLQSNQTNHSQLHQQQQQQPNQSSNRDQLSNTSNSSYNFVYVTQSSANATASIASVGHPISCLAKDTVSAAAPPSSAPTTNGKSSNESNNRISGIVKQSFGFWRGSNNTTNNSNTNNSNSNAIKNNEQEIAPTKGASMMLCPIPQPFRQQNNNQNNQSTNWLSNQQQQQKTNSNNLKSVPSINDCDYPNESGGIFFIHQQHQNFKQQPTPPPPSLQNAINTNNHHQTHNNQHYQQHQHHLQNHNIHQYQHQQNNQIPSSNGHYYHSNNSKIPLGSTAGGVGQQQNFHQISKTATNLLAEIYEKHFLNQTTFENVALLNANSRNCENQIPLGLTVTKNSSAAFITAAVGNDENNCHHKSTIIHSMNHSTSNSGGVSRLAASASSTTIVDDEFSLSSLEHKQQTVRMHVSGYPQPQSINLQCTQQQQQQQPPSVINYEHQLQLQFQPQDQQLHASFRPPSTLSCNHQQQQQSQRSCFQDNSQNCQRNSVNQQQNNYNTSYPIQQQMLQGHLIPNGCKDDLVDRSSSPYAHLYEVVPEQPPLQVQPPLQQSSHPPTQPHTRPGTTNRVLRKRSSSKSQKNQHKESNQKNSNSNIPVTTSNGLDNSNEHKQSHSSNHRGKNNSTVSANDENNFGNTINGGINCYLVQKPPPIPNLPPPPNIPPPELPLNCVSAAQQSGHHPIMQMQQRTNADGEQHPYKIPLSENHKNSNQFHSNANTKQSNPKEKNQKMPISALIQSQQQQQQQQQKIQSSDNDEQKQQQQKLKHQTPLEKHEAKISNSSSTTNNNRTKNEGGISNIRGVPNGSSSNCTTNKDNISTTTTAALTTVKNSKGNSSNSNNNNNNNNNINTIGDSAVVDHIINQQLAQAQPLIIQYAQHNTQQHQHQHQQQQLSAGIILSPDQQKIQGNNIIGSTIPCNALVPTIPSTGHIGTTAAVAATKTNYDDFNNIIASGTTETTAPNGIAKFFYRNNKIDLSEETAQVMAAAAYYATRAAAKFSQSGNPSSGITIVNGGITGSSGGTSSKTRSEMISSSRNGGFCGALQRAPPPMPPGLQRRLANKENYGIGKVKVMLRVSDVNTDQETQHFMTVDKKKRQVTLTDPTTTTNATTIATQADRAPMVAAPKMFAFDNLFTADDQQSDVCSSALSEVIPAVLEGSDGCLLSIGYPNTGQSRTMLGAVGSSAELGAIPCAISWLYKGINERRQKSGSRFSVRVSALGISATKPDSSSKDLLAAHATESDDSPGVYLRDDFLGGPTELRAPTAERAALFLDAALAGRPQSGLEPAMIFTLHVYQYSLSRKGGVAGGRSRLHLIDLGGCANRNGGLPLSGIGNILLAILSGQRHPPNKDHPMTPLLKDCLAPLTCHVSILAHVSHTQTHTDALTTIQLASRIHRMRRRKHRFPISSDKTIGVNNAAHQSGGSSEGPDPSSSDLSADTVIYMGPCDDATDGEHPPVYLPSLGSGDNRCAMNKVLKGSGIEKQSKIPSVKKSQTQKPQSPVVTNRTNSLKRLNNVPSPTPQQQSNPQGPLDHVALFSSSSAIAHNSPIKMPPSISTTKIVAGTLRHNSTGANSNNAVNTIIGGCNLVNKGSNSSTPKGSPLRRPGCGSIVNNSTSTTTAQTNVALAGGVTTLNPDSPLRQISEEQWIDGPRLSRAKVAEARHLLREINHVKQCETWIDGPKSATSGTREQSVTTPLILNQHQQSPQQQQQQLLQQQQQLLQQQASLQKPLILGNLPGTTPNQPGYGFMDSHKKIMIRQWVENQSSHVFQRGTSVSANSSPTHAAAQTTLTPQQLAVLQQQHNLQQQQQQIQQQLRTLSYQISQYSNGAVITTASNCGSPNRQLDLKTEEEQLLTRLENNNSTEMVNAIGDGLTSLITATAVESSIHIGLKTMNNNATMQNGDDTDLISEKSCQNNQQINAGSGDNHTSSGKEDDDQDSGPSEVPPALPLITPLGSREISHESLHRIISRHVSRESLAMQQQMAAMNSAMMDCGLQVTEDEIARAMSTNGEHPLAALSNGDISVVSSFNIGDAFSDCAMGERTRNQFDQLARLREIFTSQLAMAEVTPNFRMHEANSVYSEPAFRFNTGPGSVCSEPPYRPASPRCGSCRQSLNASRTPSQTSLPSLNGIMTIAGMEQYASLRHPDGASDPNLQNKTEQNSRQTSQQLSQHPLNQNLNNHQHSNDIDDDDDINNEKSVLLSNNTTSASLKHSHHQIQRPTSFEPDEKSLLCDLPIVSQNQLPLLPLNTSSETAYDSGHDSSTPRTSKHSGISRRAESGYHSVATARDSDESSFTSGSMVTKEQQLLQHHHLQHQQHLHHQQHLQQQQQQQQQQHNKITMKKKRQDKSLCNWLRNPFTCTYPETEGEISDF